MKGGEASRARNIIRECRFEKLFNPQQPKEFKMKKVRLTIAFLLIALITVVGTAAAQPTNFRAHLSGDQEVPAVATNATGQVKFQLNSDGTELYYKLIVANIDNVFASHIHCASPGVSGPIGVTLFMGSPDSGRVDGVLAQGTITAPNPGNACGWVELGDVVSAIESGNTYVNVHTNPGTPSGEIRGQIH
jgi:hypothetical protein